MLFCGDIVGESTEVTPPPPASLAPRPPSSPGNFFPSSGPAEDIVLSSSDCGAHCPPHNTCMFLRPRHLSNRLRCLVFTRLFGRGGGERESGLFVRLCCSLAASADIILVFSSSSPYFFQVGTTDSCHERGTRCCSLGSCCLHVPSWGRAHEAGSAEKLLGRVRMSEI